MFGTEPWLDRSDDRYVRMDEYIEVLNHLWSGEGRDFAGRFYRLVDGKVTTHSVRTKPAVYTASMSRAGKRSAARIGDAWFATP